MVSLPHTLSELSCLLINASKALPGMVSTLLLRSGIHKSCRSVFPKDTDAIMGPGYTVTAIPAFPQESHCFTLLVHYNCSGRKPELTIGLIFT